MGFQAYDPAKTFIESVDEMFKKVITQLTAQGYAPSDAELNMDVTGRSDEEVEVVRERAAAAGLTGAVLVDNRIPPRPGTVPSDALTPQANEQVAEARAHRILGDKYGPGRSA